MLVLAGCAQTTSGSTSMSFIDPENLINDPAVSTYGEDDLLRLGAKKTDDAYIKDVTFCGNPGQLIFRLDADSTLRFYYETEFANIKNGDYVDRFVSAYNSLSAQYGAAYGEYFTESQPETSECSIDTFKNNAGRNEGAMYSFVFPLSEDGYSKSINLAIYINNKTDTAVIILHCFGF
jgi:hypothetical protein